MRPRTRRRFRRTVVVVGFLTMLFGAGYMVHGLYSFIAEVVMADDAPEEEVEDVAEAPARKERPKEVCGCTKHHIRFKRDKYEVHREHAQRLNRNKVLTDKLVHSSPVLARVQDGKGYRIDRHKLTHSEPYLHKRAYKVLQDMGRSYSEKVKGTKAEGSAFHISSLTRTTEQQERLRRSPAGRNASPNISTHSYGASFDIYKLDNTDSCSEARKAFEAVLKEFQKNGSILLCPEGNCIHVTVKG